MDITRRDLLKAGALAGTGALLGSDGERILASMVSSGSPQLLAQNTYILAQPENILYGLCLQCNTQCTIKAKIQDGIMVKIDGNPYSPMNLQPQLSYATLSGQAAVVDGSICSKGQAGVQSQYDPYRLRKVVKRAGPRGSGKWKSIPFDQAISEIVAGGRLFSDIGEDRVVPGFKDVFVLRDAALAKAMSDDVAAIRAGKMTVDAFKIKHAKNLDLLIDPEHPDLGPKNNRFVFQGGRIAPDREAYAQRFTFGGLGSVNWYAHTTICEQAHHVAFQWATAQWKDAKGKFSWDKGTNHMKPDYTQAEFVIFWGTGYNEANFGPTPMSPQLSQAIVDGKLKIAVVDPRLSKTAAKGWWIPPIPGGDLALAMGMIRWIIEHKRYDVMFLRNANKAAAGKSGEKSWTNATWLVDTDTGKFVRAADFGLGSKDEFVVLAGGTPVAVNPNDKLNVIIGDLDVATQLHGKRVASSFRLLKNSAFAESMDTYARESGIDLTTIAELAREFTAHGKKAAIDFYRGPIKFTYGYYSAQALIILNYLIGNVDHRGGLVPGGGSWNVMGDKPGQPFNLKTLHTGALTPFGVKLTRESSGPYETSTLFKRDGYPAKRPWFPLTGDVYQEIIPAASAGYPYPIDILWLHYGTPALSAPAGHLQIAMLRDEKKIPLFIATDVVIGETSMYADYIFPDLSYVERWGNPMGTSPVTLTKATKVRQPLAAPIPEIVHVGGEAMPISMDSVMLAIAERLRAPGYGKDGFANNMPFMRPEDFYLKMVANVGWGDDVGDAVPEASNAELDILRRSRRHLPAGVFDEAKWQAAVGAHWRRTAYVLNRGGRFEAADKAYDGAFVTHTWGKLLDLYSEPVGTSTHSVLGKRFSGTPINQSMQSFDGRAVTYSDEYDLHLFTYKEVFGGQSRTVGDYAGQMALMPENFIYLNAVDAKRLQLGDGDLAQVVSTAFAGHFKVGQGQLVNVEGHIKVVQGLRPGSVAVSWHYGHWAYGARDIEVDGQRIAGETARGKGLAPNPAMGIDGYLKDVCLTDPIAGDSAFGGSKVKLVKLASASQQPIAMAPAGVYSAGPRMALHGAKDSTTTINPQLAASIFVRTDL